MTDTDAVFCLTSHGTVLTCDKSGKPFLHETLDSGIPPNAARFTLHCSTAGPRIGVTARLLPSLRSAEPANEPAFTVLATGNGRAAFLHLGKNFATAPEPQGPLQAIAKPGARAVFLFLPAQELTELLFIRDNQWLTAAGRLITRGETGFSDGFLFRFGGTASDLRHGPCHTGASPGLADITMLQDGWKIAGQLRLFRPLIYYAAFGRREIFEQLRCSLQSLAEFGAYTGHIHIISDRPEPYISQFVPPSLARRFTVQHAGGMDFWDFCLARYRLNQWPQAASFQPLLYVDADIVFDRPVEPLLKEVARSPNICVASEPFSKRRDADCAGAPLFKAAGIETGETCGFNAGCQGFPTLAAAQTYFRLVLHVAESYRALHPGGVSKFADQPFANYVAGVTQTMNTALMDAATRLSGPALSAAPARRRGMVHFWPSFQAEKKCADMRAYVKALAAAAAPKPALAAAD